MQKLSREKVQPYLRERKSKRKYEDFQESDESKDILKFAGNELRDEDCVYKLPGIPQTPCNQDRKPGVTFVLERASLVLAFVGRVNICTLVWFHDSCVANFLCLVLYFVVFKANHWHWKLTCLFLFVFICLF